MKRANVVVCGLLALAALAAPALAAATGSSSKSRTSRSPTKPQRTEKREPQLSGEYAKVADELGVSDAQKRRIAEAAQAKDKALATWDKQYGKRLDDLKRKQSEGGSASITTQIEATEKARARVEAAGHARVMACLTPEQRATWEAKTLYEDVMKQVRTSRRSGEHTAAIQNLCRQAAEKLASDRSPDARDRILAQLVATVQNMLQAGEDQTSSKRRKAASSGDKDDPKRYPGGRKSSSKTEPGGDL